MQNKNITFRRFLNNAYTCDEAEGFFSAIKDSANRRTVDNMAAEVWEETAGQPSCTLIEKENYKQEARLLLKRIEKRKPIVLKRALWIASSAAAMLAIIFSLSHLLKDTSEINQGYTEIYTGFAEKKQFLLPDGSMVVLNACSQLRYPTKFTHRKQRDVVLQGEAYFDVAKDAVKPFIVSTRHFEVQVLGTAFNVKSYNTDVFTSVDVERGRVQVEMPDAMMKLNAREQMTVNTLSGEFNKQKDNRETAVWRKGWLRFNSTPVRDVARELERVYNCRIVFREGQEFNNLISGEHDNQSLESVLQSLEFASGVTYKKEDNQILLYKK